MSILKLVITYEWSGEEPACLPQADRVMEALLATDDRGLNNQPKVSMEVNIRSVRGSGSPRWSGSAEAELHAFVEPHGGVECRSSEDRCAACGERYEDGPHLSSPVG